MALMTLTMNISASAASLDPARVYSQLELSEIADVLLAHDANRETCRACRAEGNRCGYGTRTGESEGDAPVLECPEGHRWVAGEGTSRSWGGKDPILSEAHLASRRRREILSVAGTPDPAIRAGIYWRAHPRGRSVASPEARANGARFFR